LTGCAEAFIRKHTERARPSLVPELTLRLATEITPIWQATETWLHTNNIAPPFWAFAWPGGQAVARYLLDNPGIVIGCSVLDFAAGGGIAGLAAAYAGAHSVEANDIDPLAVAAFCLNAADNGLALRPLNGDMIGRTCQWDVILAGDVCYEAPMARRVLPWLREMAATAEVLLGDPGRAYLPEEGLERLADYNVPTTLELEDQALRRTVLYRLRP
jgi:predicted nicotinamide N-methyase